MRLINVVIYLILMKNVRGDLPYLGPTIGSARVSVAYYSFYDNIQLYEPLGNALLFTSIS